MKSRVLSIIAIVAMLAGLAAAQTSTDKAFMNPANLKEKAPDVFKANFDTSAGQFVIEVHRAWSPNGADRFYNMVKTGFFDDCRFYRVVPGFMAQFGLPGDPKVTTAWSSPAAVLQDDPVKERNIRGYVSFAARGVKNSRGTQLFINFGDNAQSLDPLGFSPIGRVISGMGVVDKLYSGYGDIAEQGNAKGPRQGRASTEGNAYLAKEFPKLDYIKKATIAQ